MTSSNNLPSSRRDRHKLRMYRQIIAILWQDVRVAHPPMFEYHVL